MRWRKGLWQTPTPLHDKSSAEIRDTRNIPNHNKAISNKPVANIKLKGLNVICLQSGRTQGILTMSTQYRTGSLS